MLMLFKTEKAMPADTDTVWAEITQAGFVQQFLPEITAKNSQINPSYALNGKAISWNRNQNTNIEMANADLNLDIDSIEISLEERGNKTIVKFEVEFAVATKGAFFHSLRAVRSLFNQKLVAMKRGFEQAQTGLAFA